MTRLGGSYKIKDGKVVKTTRRQSVSQKIAAKNKTKIVRGKRVK